MRLPPAASVFAGEVQLFDVDITGFDAEVIFPTGVRVVTRGGDASRGWRVLTDGASDSG